MIVPVHPYIDRVSSRIFGLGGKNSVCALAREIFWVATPLINGLHAMTSYIMSTLHMA